MSTTTSKRAAVLIADGYQVDEAVAPVEALRTAGVETHYVGPRRERCVAPMASTSWRPLSP